MSSIDLDKIIQSDLSLDGWTFNMLEWLPTMRPGNKKTLTHLPTIQRQNIWYGDGVVETIWTTQINWYFVLSPDANTLHSWVNWTFSSVSYGGDGATTSAPARTRIISKISTPGTIEWIFIKNISIVNQTGGGGSMHSWQTWKINLIKIDAAWNITNIWDSSTIIDSSVTIFGTETIFLDTDRVGIEFESSFIESGSILYTYGIQVASWFWLNWDILLF